MLAICKCCGTSFPQWYWFHIVHLGQAKPAICIYCGSGFNPSSFALCLISVMAHTNELHTIHSYKFGLIELIKTYQKPYQWGDYTTVLELVFSLICLAQKISSYMTSLVLAQS